MSKKRLSFPNVQAITAWLRDTRDGRKILDSVRDEVSADLLAHFSCLVELQWNGSVRVWADKGVGVCVYQRPFMREALPVTDDHEAEEWAIDRIVRETVVPGSYRHLLAGKPRKESACRGASIRGMLERAEFLEFLYELQDWHEEYSQERVCIFPRRPINGRSLGLLA